MRKLVVLILMLPLAACGDEKPTVTISSDYACEQSTEVMIRMAQACAQGGGKYPEDCIKSATSHFCPEVSVYRVTFNNQSGPWTQCSKAKSPEAKSACSVFDK